MKEELQHKLVEVIGSIQSAAGKASDFALEQLPDIAQSYLLYGRVSAAAQTLICIAFVLVSALGIYNAWKTRDSTSWSDDLFSFMGGGWWISIGGALLGLIGLSASLNSLALVWFAPKVWLLKELAGLIK